jgi:hypothetical protein
MFATIVQYPLFVQEEKGKKKINVRQNLIDKQWSGLSNNRTTCGVARD